jgi:hypothetical protein
MRCAGRSGAAGWAWSTRPRTPGRAGTTAFPSDNDNVLVHRALSGERPPLDERLAHVSAPLRAVVTRALDPDPDLDRRYADAAEMLCALDPDATLGAAVTQPALLVAAALVGAAATMIAPTMNGAAPSATRCDV